MTWNLQQPIPATDPLVLVTSGSSCALYEDGDLTSLGDPALTGSNQIELNAAVRHLIRVASVTLVEDVDRRLIIDDAAERGPVRRRKLSEVEAVRVRLARAAQLRDEAAQRTAEANRLEGRAR